jgi:hypothetical protein
MSHGPMEPCPHVPMGHGTRVLCMGRGVGVGGEWILNGPKQIKGRLMGTYPGRASPGAGFAKDSPLAARHGTARFRFR